MLMMSALNPGSIMHKSKFIVDAEDIYNDLFSFTEDWYCEIFFEIFDMSVFVILLLGLNK